jgi:septum formation protein
MEEDGASPRDVVDALAEFKARKGQDKNPDALVLGSDQVLALKGTCLW